MKSNQENMKAMEKFALLLEKNRKLLSIIFLSLIALLVISGVVSEINKKIDIKAAVFAEAAEEKYAEWLDEKDEEKKKELETDLLNQFQTIEKKYKGRYAFIRASLLKGDFHFENKEWTEAESIYSEIALKYSKTYFAPICLIKAAVSAENSENADKAIEYLTVLLEKYKNSSADVPRAIFNLGRLYESKENKEEALKYYKMLEDDFSTSNWTKLAIDRIIYLTK